MTSTTFDNRVAILAQLWLDYKEDEEFTDFVEYNDLGLPLAFMLYNDVVTPQPMAEVFINETFDLLLSGLDISEDTGFEVLEDLFEASPNK